MLKKKKSHWKHHQIFQLSITLWPSMLMCILLIFTGESVEISPKYSLVALLLIKLVNKTCISTGHTRKTDDTVKDSI